MADRELDETYVLMMEREAKARELYRFAASAAADREASQLFERLAQRCDAYHEKLRESRAKGRFQTRPCTLPDRNYAATLEQGQVGPQSRPLEVIIFAIGKERADHRRCVEGARRAKSASAKKLWLALAEEERLQRLELEAYYEKEVISKI